MQRVRFLTLASACLCLSCLVTAQTSTSLLDASNPRFYLLQPFHAASAAERLALHHIGIEVIEADDAFIVNSLLDDYPAARAGMRRGDRILSVNGEPFYPEYFIESAARANSGDARHTPLPVSITLLRDGQTLNLDMHTVFENLFDSRRSAALSSIQEFSAGNKTIAYYHPWALSRNLNDLVSFTGNIDSIALSDGLILDLRDSYGFLSIQHLDAFLPAGRVLASVMGQGNVHTRLETTAPALLTRHYGKPVAILINAGTAGGAELLAYQLAALDRITTIGETTAGELGEYTIQATPDAVSLRYLPAANTSIDGIPLSNLRVEPELPIAFPLSLNTRSDPQFQAAFNLLLGLI